VLAWLDGSGIQAVFVGGIAGAALARARVTRDVDLLAALPQDGLEGLPATLGPFGLAVRAPDAISRARRSAILPLRHAASGLDIDVLIAVAPFHQEVIAAGSWADYHGVQLRLPRVEDLLIMKALAGRPKDQIDIVEILEFCGDAGVDLARVRRSVAEVAEATAMPERVDELDRLIRAAR